MLQSPIGRVASQPMRNIETFPSKHMYLYLSLVERKVAEFYHNMVKMTYFHRFLQTIDGVLATDVVLRQKSKYAEATTLFWWKTCLQVSTDYIIPVYLGSPPILSFQCGLREIPPRSQCRCKICIYQKIICTAYIYRTESTFSKASTFSFPHFYQTLTFRQSFTGNIVLWR